MKKYVYILGLIAILGIGKAFGQTRVHVVTKTITKTFEASPATILKIYGEKAIIRIKPSPDLKIRLTLSLISKNPVLENARDDVKYCDYTIRNELNTISVSNTFTNKPGFKTISSNLEASFEVEIPEKLLLAIQNVYGDVYLDNTTATSDIQISYGQLKLNKISGNTRISANYCDISGNEINANLSINAQQTDIKLRAINNNCLIYSKFGAVDLGIEKSTYICLNGNMTKVSISIANINNYSLFFEAVNGEIIVPETYRKYMSNVNKTNKFIFAPGKSVLKVTTSYNTIILNPN